MTLALTRRFARDHARICKIIGATHRRAELLPTGFSEVVLVLEDKNFWTHAGVDLSACARALFHFARGQPRGGASTIEMQLARTVTGYRARTLARKLYEIALAVSIARRVSKPAILSTYLSIAYFGAGLEGYQSACRRLFGRGANGLSALQQAQLAALLLYPHPREVSAFWQQKMERRALYGVMRLKHEQNGPNRISWMAHFSPLGMVSMVLRNAASVVGFLCGTANFDRGSHHGSRRI